MRFTDWHARLIALIEERKPAPFVWGVNDCCLWPADAVLAMTGHDLAADLRGTYSTARGAASVLRYLGGLPEAIGRGGREIPPLCAATGDVGIVTDGERLVGAVCIGENWLVVAGRGLGLIPLMSARRAWRIA